jgi:hypothetical protein
MPDVEHKHFQLSHRKQNPLGGVEYLADFLRMVRALRRQRATQGKSIQAFDGSEQPINPSCCRLQGFGGEPIIKLSEYSAGLAQ